eukprot:16440124-Heterocapsa_arctica.AAC.2
MFKTVRHTILAHTCGLGSTSDSHHYCTNHGRSTKGDNARCKYRRSGTDYQSCRRVFPSVPKDRPGPSAPEFARAQKCSTADSRVPGAVAAKAEEA